ncbi:hypothetical protein [Chlamydiifrater phoenicopteri]|uniref:hypothetical protein n=1 Tax=Chlamydiifrater phoenicopteri TaxID=2681469 RepID=UPI001BCFB932|nr:hypothetical protein [Chlamydiifrater phoenicopteri]
MEPRTRESVFQQPETHGSLTLSPSYDLSLDQLVSCCFEENIKILLEAYYDESKRGSILKAFKKHPILKAHEIAAAAYMLSSLEEGIDLDFSFLNLESSNSGAVKLFRYGGLPWGGLPYPREHAELGLMLLKIGEFYDEARDRAQAMIAYQQALFTHEEKVLPSLWTQGGNYKEKEVTRVSKSFLYQMGEKPFSEYSFVDHELGFWMRRSLSSAAFISASGCKSGMGAFLVGDSGVISYGPHEGEIDHCLGFGLASLVKSFVINEGKDAVEASFISRASKTSSDRSRYRVFTNSGIGPHVSSHVVIAENSFLFESVKMEHSSHTFSLFFKGKTCSVSGGPALRATAPDSYRGPMSSIIIRGERDGVRLTFSSARDEIKIFSLNGGADFWGADFLVNVSYKESKIAGRVERI